MPLGGLPFSAVFMNARRVIPFPVDRQRPSANFTDLIVPGTVFMVLGHVAPVLMYMNVSTTVATAYVVPTRHDSFHLAVAIASIPLTPRNHRES